MATITYQFAIGQTVYYMSEDVGVRDGVVMDIMVDIQPAVTTISYDVAFVTARYGSITTPEPTLFALADDAWAAYKLAYLS